MSGKDFSGCTRDRPCGKVVDTRLAHQHGVTVDLGAARTAFRSLAVPPAREIGVEVVLHVVHRVEDHHARNHRDLVRDLRLLATRNALEHVESQRLAGEPARGEHVLHGRLDGRRRLVHDCHYFFFLLGAAVGPPAGALGAPEGSLSVRYPLGSLALS